MKLIAAIIIVLFCTKAQSFQCSKEKLKIIYNPGFNLVEDQIPKNAIRIAEILNDNKVFMGTKGIDPNVIITDTLVQFPVKQAIDFVTKGLLGIPDFGVDLSYARKITGNILQGATEVLDEDEPLAKLIRAYQLLDDYIVRNGIPNRNLVGTKIKKYIEDFPDNKILIVSEGIGAYVVEFAMRQLPLNVKSRVAHLAISPPRTGLTSINWNFSHYTSSSDVWHKARVATDPFGAKNKLSPNVKPLLVSDYSTAGLSALYLSDEIVQFRYEKEDDPKPTPGKMSEHFQWFSHKLQEKLPNDDFNCCGLRLGRLFQTNKDCIRQDCFGGFLENTVTFDPQSNIKLDAESQICGSVSLQGNIDLKKTKITYTPIEDNKKFEIINNVTMDNVKIDILGVEAFDPIIDGTTKVVIKSARPEPLLITKPINLRGDIEIIDSDIPKRLQMTETIRVNGVTIKDGLLDKKREVDIVSLILSGNTTITGGVLEGKISLKDVSATSTIFKSHEAFEKRGIVIEKNCGDDPIQIVSSEIKDNVSFKGCGVFDTALVQGAPTMTGHVSVVDSSILAFDLEEQDPGRMVINANSSPNGGVEIRNNSSLIFYPQLEGDLLVSNAVVSENGVYRGETVTTAAGVRLTPTLFNGEFSGANNFSGIYSLGKGLVGSVVEGEFLPFQTSGLIMAITPQATVDGFVSLKGSAFVDGRLFQNTYLEGLDVSGGIGGIHVLEGAQVGGGGETKAISGGVFFKRASSTNSKITGTGIDPTNILMLVEDGAVTDSTISGLGEFKFSTVDTSTVNGSGFSLLSATIRDSVILGATILCNGNFIGQVYNGVEICNPPPLKSASNGYESVLSNEMGQVLSYQRAAQERSVKRDSSVANRIFSRGFKTSL